MSFFKDLYFAFEYNPNVLFITIKNGIYITKRSIIQRPMPVLFS